MRLDGIHHVTCITADAPRNVDFYTRVLGLRLVKKTVNQDDPTVYHLFYADEEGSAGSDITFFEYPSARPGQAGDGMVHTVVWRVASTDALEFWADRLSAEGHEVEADGESLRFANPEGLRARARRRAVADEPLVAQHPEIPPELALQGFEGSARTAARASEFLDESSASSSGTAQLGHPRRDARRLDRVRRGAATCPASAAPAPSTTSRGLRRWSDHQAWHDRVADAGGQPTQIIDRFWFRSIYFREPAGVLFEIATLGPGFATDEDPAHLGEKLILPPAFEHLRDRVEPVLHAAARPAGRLGRAVADPSGMAGRGPGRVGLMATCRAAAVRMCRRPRSRRL